MAMVAGPAVMLMDEPFNLPCVEIIPLDRHGVEQHLRGQPFQLAPEPRPHRHAETVLSALED